MYRKIAGLFLIAFDSSKGRNVYERRKYLEKTQWMKKSELQRLQVKRLRALLIHAYENVPYYRESFKKANFRPADFNCLEDLCKIPVLRKSEIREKLEKLMAKNISKKELICRFTGGTTAAPVKLYRSKKDVSWGVAAELRGYGWAGYRVGDKLGLIWRIRLSQNRNFVFKIENALRRYKYLDIRRFSEKSMESFARKMHRFKPDFINGHSGATNAFATFVLQDDHFKIRPKAVFTTVETLLPHYRKTIQEAFKCKVYDHYGCNEVSHIAAQCGQHEGLHINEENIIVEIVKDDEPASSGEEGQVLLTNLHSFAMPFIRYDIGDLGKIFSDTCSCGRELSLVKPVGRTHEYFVNSDGSFTFLRDFQTIFEDLPIKDFQVVQESFDEIVLKIAPRPGYTKGHTDFILKRIKYAGPINVRVELVDSIPPEKGKIKHFLSKIATNYA